MKSSNTLRWGILGTGGIAQAFAADLQGLKGHQVFAVGSRTLESARRFGQEFRVPHLHGSYEALVADPDVGRHLRDDAASHAPFEYDAGVERRKARSR